MCHGGIHTINNNCPQSSHILFIFSVLDKTFEVRKKKYTMTRDTHDTDPK